MTRKSMTQPHTCAVTIRAFLSAPDELMCPAESPFVLVEGALGKAKALNTADRIWIPHSHQAIDGLENRTPVIPKRKAGPALLTNPSILFACGSDRVSFRYPSATACAPVGYPPRRPIKNKDSAPWGICRSLPTGRRNLICFPDKFPVSSMDRKKNGNKEGITVNEHSAMAS